MSKKAIKPEEKGFFDKVKDTVGGIWSGTKDKAEDLKDAATSTFEDFKEKVTPEKPKAEIPAAKKSAKQKPAASAGKPKAAAAKTKPDGKEERKTAKKKVTEIKSGSKLKPETSKKSK